LVRYKVGAEHAVFLEARSNVADRNARGEGRQVPRGITHAVDVTTGEVACGRPRDGLIDFPTIDWERAAFLVACHECRAVVLE